MQAPLRFSGRRRRSTVMSSAHRRAKRPRMKRCLDKTSSNTEFGMNRRDMMKLAYLAVLPVMPGAAMADPKSKTSPLSYKVFTVTRPGLNRDVPPGKESLMWVANSSTLISGERDAVLVDTFLTVDQSKGLADAIVASGKTLKAIYRDVWRRGIRPRPDRSRQPKHPLIERVHGSRRQRREQRLGKEKALRGAQRLAAGCRPAPLVFSSECLAGDHVSRTVFPPCFSTKKR